jgi:ATP-dependent helicase/DNAse subunit B
MDEYLQRIDSLSQQAHKFQSYEAREDLDRMIAAVRAVAQDLSRELVECQRLRRITVRAQSFEAKLVDLLTNAEQMMVYAQLRYR